MSILTRILSPRLPFSHTSSADTQPEGLGPWTCSVDAASGIAVLARAGKSRTGAFSRPLHGQAA
eukprot:787813-Rhodomonas_salina.1